MHSCQVTNCVATSRTKTHEEVASVSNNSILVAISLDSGFTVQIFSLTSHKDLCSFFCFEFFPVHRIRTLKKMNIILSSNNKNHWQPNIDRECLEKVVDFFLLLLGDFFLHYPVFYTWSYWDGNGVHASSNRKTHSQDKQNTTRSLSCKWEEHSEDDLN